MSNNKYVGFTETELKSLLRVNKTNPAAVVQINEALEALTPYIAGRLTNKEMSKVGIALASAASALEKAGTPEALAAMETCKTASESVSRFHKDNQTAKLVTGTASDLNPTVSAAA